MIYIIKSKNIIKFNLKDEKCFSLPLSIGFLKPNTIINDVNC